ncbi:DUF1508 domain-containing protein [Flavobacteriaceae bacterium TK19130]|nr:DUF1508 domain-containing protein [Thermobacterium salinum]
MGKPKFEIEKSRDSQFYFNLKAGNGQVIVTSETYVSKQSCKHAIEVTKDIAEEAEIEDLT